MLGIFLLNKTAFTLNFITVAEQKSGVVFVSIFCFFYNVHEICEMLWIFEMMIVVNMQERHTGILFVVVHYLIVVISLIVVESCSQTKEKDYQWYDFFHKNGLNILNQVSWEIP